MQSVHTSNMQRANDILNEMIEQGYHGYVLMLNSNTYVVRTWK